MHFQNLLYIGWGIHPFVTFKFAHIQSPREMHVFKYWLQTKNNSPSLQFPVGGLNGCLWKFWKSYRSYWYAFCRTYSWTTTPSIPSLASIVIEKNSGWSKTMSPWIKTRHQLFLIVLVCLHTLPKPSYTVHLTMIITSFSIFATTCWFPTQLKCQQDVTAKFVIWQVFFLSRYVSSVFNLIWSYS
jgi:hypothetical protein